MNDATNPCRCPRCHYVFAYSTPTFCPRCDAPEPPTPPTVEDRLAALEKRCKALEERLHLVADDAELEVAILRTDLQRGDFR